MADITTYDSLVSDIRNGKIGKLYLLFGPEELLIDDIIDRIEKKIVNPSLKSLNYVRIDGSTAVFESVMNACETLPFMDSRKLVIIKGCSFFKCKAAQTGNGSNEDYSGELYEYLSDIPDTTVLIMTSNEVDKRNKLYNLIKKNGVTAEFLPLKSQELVKWIIKAFEKWDKIISRSDAVYFTERVQGSLNDMTNEIEKICSYTGDRKEIQTRDIDAVVTKSLENNIFQLVDSITSKKTGRALYIFNDLLLDSEPILKILTMIVRQYRLILNAKLMTEANYSNDAIAEKLGLRPFAVNNLMRLSSHMSTEILRRRLERCLETDGAIKTGKMDGRIAMETLIVEFTR